MTITLKNVPEHIHENWKKRAQQNGRSLNKEILQALEEENEPDIEQELEQIRRLREKTGIKTTHECVDAAKRMGRA
jgi:plasmid stability protein